MKRAVKSASNKFRNTTYMADPSYQYSTRDFYFACTASLLVHIVIFFPDRVLFTPIEAGVSGVAIPFSAVLIKSNGNVAPANAGGGHAERKDFLSHELLVSRPEASVFSKKGVSTVASVMPVKKRLPQPVIAQVETPSPVSEDDLAVDHIAFYRLSLARVSRGLAGYPSNVKRNGQEGRVVLNILGKAGRSIPSVGIQQSSGYGLLDDHAREMVLQAVSQVQVPDALRGRSFTIAVPVEYRLAD